MSSFVKFRDAVDAQIQKMSERQCFRVGLSVDQLWSTYLGAFPEGSDPIHVERTEHDCNCCRNFIRDVGNMIAINGTTVETIWDINVGGMYQEVADAMSKLVKSKKIQNVFLHDQRKIGIVKNFGQTKSGESVQYDHFCTILQSKFVVSRGKSVAEEISSYTASHGVLKRSLEEITAESVEIVLDLIDSNSIYRGAEHRRTVELLRSLKAEYRKLKTAITKDRFIWSKVAELQMAARIRNTVIGTLLTDISDGVELEKAVKSFETKVAPTNYKRTSALITQKMINAANETVQSLGIEDSLFRRFARADDLTINNVLFADRKSKAKMGGVLDDLKPTASTTTKRIDNVKEVSIEEFISKILPKVETLELLVENRHESKLVSVIAPEHPSSPNILKWDNNFSWSYNGEVTDSIKERVKAAGGNVTGEVRASLSWFNYDDLDISVIEPDGTKIYFGDDVSRKTGGQLDVDMNAGTGKSRSAVENIFWKSAQRMPDGEYKVVVHNFRKRETTDVGFEIEIDIRGNVTHLSHPKDLRDQDRIVVATIHKSGSEFTVIPGKGVSSTTASKDVWGIKTQEFVPVDLVMLSPNFWDGQEVGNKHWFFILKDCKNPDPARGFYNEFLNGELTKHRKVFEVLSSKMKTGVSDEQLSGLGFSSTQEDSVTCKLSGSFNRVVKIKF